MRPTRTATAVAMAALVLVPALASGASAHTVRISRTSSGGPINGPSTTGGSAISADGRFVAFQAEANGVVPGDTNMCPTGGTPPALPCADVFVADRQSGTIEMESVSSSGEQGQLWSRLGGLSADGRLVVFDSPSGQA